MLVKDVIISALNILARTDLSEALSEGGIPEGEGGETVETLLYCFNAVEDELARRYVPLSAKEELRSYSGKFKYSDFSHSPVKIKRVLVGGKEADYEQTPQYIAVNADTVTIEYEYAPSKRLSTVLPILKRKSAKDLWLWEWLPNTVLSTEK